jgi:ribosome-binding factor A
MQEGKRQKQVSSLLQEEISGIFQRLGLNMMDGGMVSVSSVKITPDLLEARIYLSIFNVADEKALLKKIEERKWEVKKELASRVKTQLRRIPELRIYLDDSLDNVFRMEEIFRQIKSTEEGGKQDDTNTQDPS